MSKFNSPALKCCWNGQNNNVYVGLGDGSIKAYDLSTGSVVDVGKHSTPISSLHYINGQNILVSSGYENVINFWQPGNNQPVLNVSADSKVYTTDFQFPILIAGAAN